VIFRYDSETETVCASTKFGHSKPGGAVLKKTTHISGSVESLKNGQRSKEGQLITWCTEKLTQSQLKQNALSSGSSLA
jgi:hypothetical protein